MTIATQPMFIESIYPPDQLVTASAGRRLGGYVLDGVLLIVTLFIGWWLWFAIVAPRGQSPGKQLLGMYIIKADGTRAGGGYTWLRDIVVQGIVFGIISAITSGLGWVVSALWCLWDKDRQCLWDKVAGTYIAWSPNAFKPLTLPEHLRMGVPLPILQGSSPQPAAPRAAAPPPAAAPSPPTETPAAEAPPAETPPAETPPAAPEAALAAAPQSVADQLRELNRLHDERLITDEEFESRRARLLEQL